MVQQSRRNEQVDITKKPISDPSMKENLGITLGDLHANAVKFLFFLVKEGVVDTTDEHYNQLVEIYNQSDLPENTSLAIENHSKQLVILRKIINALVVKNKETLVRLIGDELADRGKNDLFILLLLDKLQKEKLTVEILISNHGIEFIKAYEQKARFKSQVIGHLAQSISMENLQKFIDVGLVSRAEIEQIVGNAYMPKLKLISYSMETDKSGIRIYSHAPIDLAIVQKIANKLGIEYKDDTVVTLAQTIDNINTVFQENYVATGKVNELFKNINDQADPFTFLIWNRNYTQLNRNPRHHNYNVYYIHGHDSSEKSCLNIFNLDNPLGKPGKIKGLYDAMHTYGLNLSEIKKMNYRKDSETLSRKRDQLLAYRNDLELLRKKYDELKEKSLKDPQYLEVSNVTLALYVTLKRNVVELEENKISYEVFKSNSLDAMKQAKPVLSQHRGWKHLLANIVLGIVGLGVFYALAGLFNLAVNGHFLFFNKTSSLEMLEELENHNQFDNA
jgi:hypothetical protein